MSDRISPALLEQALKSCDESTLKFILRRTDPEEVQALVKPLNPSLLPIVIKSLNKFIVNEPGYLATVLPWLEQIISLHQDSIASSGECQSKLSDLQQTLKQRTQHVGLFVEASAISEFVLHEREGKGIGLPVNDEYAQILEEPE